MKSAVLPQVPTIDSPPASNAPAIVEAARARAVVAPPLNGAPKKPSGAWYRKAREARARGEPPPAWPGQRAAEAPPPAPPVVDPSPPAPIIDAPAAPTAEPPALASVIAAETEAQRAERERAEAVRQDEARRAEMTSGPGLEKMERRAASASKAVFAIIGLLLGDEHNVWPLNDVQAQSIAELLCEAWPDEMAELMREGGLTKVLAISTITQIVREKWTRHKRAKAGELPPPGDPVRVVEPPPNGTPPAAAAPKRFTGLADMAPTG